MPACERTSTSTLDPPPLVPLAVPRCAYHSTAPRRPLLTSRRSLSLSTMGTCVMWTCTSSCILWYSGKCLRTTAFVTCRCGTQLSSTLRLPSKSRQVSAPNRRTNDNDNDNDTDNDNDRTSEAPPPLPSPPTPPRPQGSQGRRAGPQAVERYGKAKRLAAMYNGRGQMGWYVQHVELIVRCNGRLWWIRQGRDTTARINRRTVSDRPIELSHR